MSFKARNTLPFVPFFVAYLAIRYTSKLRFARESVYEMFQLLHRPTAVLMRYNCLVFDGNASILFRFFQTSMIPLRETFGNLLPTIAIILCGYAAILGQNPPASQEISEADGLPVLLKHLPSYDQVQARAVFVTDRASLQNAAGDQPVFSVLEFAPGTEAVTATYTEGRLVIIEFTNPQSSADADAKIQEFLTRSPQPATVYRRIGNYNAFVFGSNDPAAATALLDQIRYEKTIQWLGEDPYLMQKLQRYMVTTSKDIVISTVLVIVLGLGGSLVAGIAAGFVFFRVRDQKRATRTAFSDAGGLTRLNLDGLSE